MEYIVNNFLAIAFAFLPVLTGMVYSEPWVLTRGDWFISTDYMGRHGSATGGPPWGNINEWPVRGAAMGRTTRGFAWGQPRVETHG